MNPRTKKMLSETIVVTRRDGSKLRIRESDFDPKEHKRGNTKPAPAAKSPETKA